MQALNAQPKLQPSLSMRMKDVYEDTPVGGDLDPQYGDNVGGPPKNRRAGEAFRKQAIRSEVLNDILKPCLSLPSNDLPSILIESCWIRGDSAPDIITWALWDW